MAAPAAAMDAAGPAPCSEAPPPAAVDAVSLAAPRSATRVLSVGFALVFVAFLAAQALQSSVNGSSGVVCLAALYLAFVASAIPAPALVARASAAAMRRTLCWAAVTYVAMIALNLPQNEWALLSGCVAVGLGGGFLWGVQGVALGRLGVREALAQGVSLDVAAADLAGTFAQYFMFAGVVGYGASSAVLLAVDGSGGDEAAEDGGLSAGVVGLFAAMSVVCLASVAVFEVWLPDIGPTTVAELAELEQLEVRLAGGAAAGTLLVAVPAAAVVPPAVAVPAAPCPAAPRPMCTRRPAPRCW